MTAVAQERRHPTRPSWAYSAVTLGVLVLMLLTAVLREGGGPTQPSLALLTFAVLGWLPLTVRHLWPVPVLAATVAISAAQMLTLPLLDTGWDAAVGIAAYQPVPIAAAVAAYAVAERRTGRRWAPGIVAAVLLPAVSILVSGVEHLWTAFVMGNLVNDGTAAGAIVAGRREHLERDAQERLDLTRREVEAERLRIARELHDVLAHHLTLVNTQAGVADYLVRSDPDAAAKALEGMTRHTRQALDELRATVGLLRTTPDSNAASSDDAASDGHARPPLPTLAQLPALLDTVRRAGLTVHTQTIGTTGELAPGADLAAYRIIQEAVTNATKHAPGQPVVITLTWADDELTLRVANPILSNAAAPTAAPTTATGASAGSGHGLLGMNERTRAAGGTWSVQGPTRTDRQFIVTAQLPATRTPTTPAEPMSAEPAHPTPTDPR